MTKAMPVAEALAADASRGIGAANAVAARALKEPVVLAELVECLKDERKHVFHRAANALKKVQRTDAEKVRPFAKAILRAAQRVDDIHTRWNLTILLGGLELKGRDRALAIDLLFDALGGESSFLRVFAMQSLVEMAAGDAALRRRLRPMVEAALEDPSAPMRARARKLMAIVGS